VRFDGVEVHRQFLNTSLVDGKTKIFNEIVYSDKEFLNGTEELIKKMLTPEALRTFKAHVLRRKNVWSRDPTPGVKRVLQPWESNLSVFGKNFFIRGEEAVDYEFYFKLEQDKNFVTDGRQIIINDEFIEILRVKQNLCDGYGFTIYKNGTLEENLYNNGKQ
jgi:hypothetical protein